MDKSDSMGGRTLNYTQQQENRGHFALIFYILQTILYIFWQNYSLCVHYFIMGFFILITINKHQHHSLVIFPGFCKCEEIPQNLK